MSKTLSPADTSEDRFITVTPAGCYFAVESGAADAARQLLHKILAKSSTPALSEYGTTDTDLILEMRKAGLITLGAPWKALPTGNLSDLLPEILPSLSERERVVLAESRQGFSLDYTGVNQHEAEELAVLAASLRVISEKRSTLLARQLSITSRAFGIVDPAGNSEIGFWPLHVADNVFTLIILGIPRFNSTQFCTLVWALIERYGPHQQSQV